MENKFPKSLIVGIWVVGIGLVLNEFNHLLELLQMLSMGCRRWPYVM